ncbi:glutathione reductase [Wallemia mellicola]|nr:glutathione reductase [Wallemia mellicola]
MSYLRSAIRNLHTTIKREMPPVNKPSEGLYDIVVIGGGSGGLGAARRSAQYGAKAAIIEAQPKLGGTCVNVGCVPKKVAKDYIMWHAADLAHHINHARYYELSKDISDAYTPHKPRFNWADFKKKRDAYIERLNGIYDRNVAKDGVEYHHGWGSISNKDGTSVKVARDDGTTYEITTKNVVVAVGGRPRIPTEIPGAELGITSDGFFDLEEQPRRVAVVGAGYIAIELAGIFNSLGSETSLLIRQDKVLRNFDTIIQDTVTNEAERQGVDIKKHTNVTKVEKTSDGLLVHLDNGEPLTVDCLLWAVGRVPETEGAGAKIAGIQTDERDHIKVDKYQAAQLADNKYSKNIYAIGDVQGKAELTPVALAAGRRLGNRLYGPSQFKDDHLDYNTIPSVIFSHPPAGSVGLSETDARKQFGDDVKIYTSKFTNMYNSMFPQEEKEPSAFKLIVVGENEKVVGLHLVGQGSDEMLQGFAVAIKMGATKKDFDNTVAIHPTAAEEVVTMT